MKVRIVAIETCASLVDDAWTWHARLGHENFYTLEMMGKKRMVTGISKDEALAKFKIFKAQVEMETAHKVKVLRTDHEEAVRHAVYLLNRLPTKAVRDITPYEGWKKRKPNLEYLKIFSCLTFVKKMGGHLTKLEDRSMPMVHLGIGGGSGMAKQSPSSSSGSVPVNDTVPFDTFDDTHVRGTRLLQEIYEREPMMTEEEVQDKYQQAGLLLLNKELTSFHEATKDIQWMESMRAEIDSIEKNRTDASGMVTKHKARLVAKGCVQQKGVDFEDAFALVARMESIRLILALAAKENWIVYHLDVKSAFLNGELKEELTKDEGGKEVDPTKYRSIIGSLRYLLNTCLDLIYSVEVVSKYMQSPTESHYAAVKKILRYLKGTTEYGLKYPKGGNGKICEYSDSSHASDIEY
nr:zinc finger, CCHC-type [Tanacetum cinerariifolium]